MLKRIKFTLVSQISLMLFGAIILYHILILLQIIPFELTWGGRLQNEAAMYRYEAVSISLNLVFFLVVLHKSRLVKRCQKSKFINILLYLLAGLFALNTIGNLLALNSLETYIFTPVTFVLTIFCWRLAVE